jgi:hypothetical protein
MTLALQEKILDLDARLKEQMPTTPPSVDDGDIVWALSARLDALDAALPDLSKLRADLAGDLTTTIVKKTSDRVEQLFTALQKKLLDSDARRPADLPDAPERRPLPPDYSATQLPRIGMRILLHNLKRTDLNGKFATILSVGDERAGVLLDDSDMKMSIRYANLLVVATGPPPSGLASTTCPSRSSSAESGATFYAQQPSAAPPAV